MIDFWFGNGAYDRLPPQVRGYLNGAAPKNADDVRASFAETLAAEQLAAFDRPVDIAVGGASPPVAPGIAAALASLLPRASVTTIAGATHGMLDGHPAEVAQLIAAER
jgi:pimeloyl-ACP methyl ester carboxylesterase